MKNFSFTSEKKFEFISDVLHQIEFQDKRFQLSIIILIVRETIWNFIDRKFQPQVQYLNISLGYSF